ncbi:LacI family DNA-binding transcriptional regulator [Actinomadura litoris]|uniref:LacI family DNA-binding transcriptional regulator n=1 Tax=Actinomadura litoris TaxID=2678616 RepID=UPI0035E40329
MADVAKRAKVSVGTVSHVLRHPDRVATGARERVEEAILAMGYAPSTAAPATRSGRAALAPIRVRDVGVPPCGVGLVPQGKAPQPARPVPLLGEPWPGSLSEDVTPSGPPRCAGRRSLRA